MKYIILLTLCIPLVGCFETGCCDPPPPYFPQIRILDSNNTDLLDPKNKSSYDHSKISFNLAEPPFRNFQLEIERPLLNSSDSGKYRMYVKNVSTTLPKDGSMTFHLHLSDIDTDTIVVHVKNSRTHWLELNGEEWTEKDTVDYTYIIRK